MDDTKESCLISTRSGHLPAEESGPHIIRTFSFITSTATSMPPSNTTRDIDSATPLTSAELGFGGIYSTFGSVVTSTSAGLGCGHCALDGLRDVG